MSTNSRLTSALNRIQFSRQYTGQFLSDLTDDEWFWTPGEFTTHIAWQVGHLTVAQYNLCLRRVRGRTPDDMSLISDGFIEAFQLGSKPVAEPAGNPPLAEIRRVFDAVHQTALSEMASRTDIELDVPLEQPHRAFRTKLEAVEYCPQHELVHAGQIALLRRMQGKPPLR
jgi:hypothetical protein